MRPLCQKTLTRKPKNRPRSKTKSAQKSDRGVQEGDAVEMEFNSFCWRMRFLPAPFILIRILFFGEKNFYFDFFVFCVWSVAPSRVRWEGFLFSCFRRVVLGDSRVFHRGKGGHLG